MVDYERILREWNALSEGAKMRLRESFLAKTHEELDTLFKENPEAIPVYEKATGLKWIPIAPLPPVLPPPPVPPAVVDMEHKLTSYAVAMLKAWDFPDEERDRIVREELETTLKSLAESVIEVRITQEEAEERLDRILAPYRFIAPPPSVLPPVKPPVPVKPPPPYPFNVGFLKHYWRDIVEHGLYDVMEGITGRRPPKADIEEYIKLAKKMLIGRKPGDYLEWIITSYPYAQSIIDLLVSIGCEAEEFRKFFMEEAPMIIERSKADVTKDSLYMAFTSYVKRYKP